MACRRQFNAKVADVRAFIANAPRPSFLSAPSRCTFVDFQPLTVEHVTRAIQQLPDSSAERLSRRSRTTPRGTVQQVSAFGLGAGSVQGSVHNAAAEEA